MKRKELYSLGTGYYRCSSSSSRYCIRSLPFLYPDYLEDFEDDFDDDFDDDFFEDERQKRRKAKERREG